MSTIALSGSARAYGNSSRRTTRARPLAIMHTAVALAAGSSAGLPSRTWPGLPGGCRWCSTSTAVGRACCQSAGTADTVLAALLAAVAESVASGTWDRLKICRNPDCRWAYYDQSRNLSRAWLDGRVRQPGQGQG